MNIAFDVMNKTWATAHVRDEPPDNTAIRRVCLWFMGSWVSDWKVGRLLFISDWLFRSGVAGEGVSR